MKQSTNGEKKYLKNLLARSGFRLGFDNKIRAITEVIKKKG